MAFDIVSLADFASKETWSILPVGWVPGDTEWTDTASRVTTGKNDHGDTTKIGSLDGLPTTMGYRWQWAVSGTLQDFTTLYAMTQKSSPICHAIRTWIFKWICHTQPWDWPNFLNNSSETVFIKNLSMHKCFKFTGLPLYVDQILIYVVVGKLFNIFHLSHFLALLSCDIGWN